MEPFQPDPDVANPSERGRVALLFGNRFQQVAIEIRDIAIRKVA